MDTVRRNLDCGYFGGGGGAKVWPPSKIIGGPLYAYVKKKHKRTMMGFSPKSEVGRPQTS